MIKNTLKLFLLLSLTNLQANEQDPVELESVSIVGEETTSFQITGSAHFIDSETLEKFDYDDIHRVLAQVPGVYVREEDGYGLRPNIGMRGGNSDRSKKVVLLEDGILFGPAPYSAPAAYYFPMTTRMQSIEVFKGPSAIAHGPNTIGGAINLITKQFTFEKQGRIDLSLGQDMLIKTHLHYEHPFKQGSILIEGLHLQSDGFKDLDFGGDTGFDKDEFMVKLTLFNDENSHNLHQWDAKLGYAAEDSNETYLGLSDVDFNKNAYRRYTASQKDKMEWDRTQFQLRHTFSNNKGLSLNTTLYRHDFERNWIKINSIDNISLFDITTNPTTLINAVNYSIITGQSDSSNETIYVGANQREFYSQGIQLKGSYDFTESEVRKVNFGLRYHSDEISRNHTEDGYSMVSGQLVHKNNPTQTTTRNTHQSDALSAHVLYEHQAKKWFFSPGLRIELIDNHAINNLTGTYVDNKQHAYLPGFGASYAINEKWSFITGTHIGFSPVAPGQANSINPETSLNSEIGARFNGDILKFESIAFLNDYQNLTDNDRQSTGGTGTGIQFNGGEVQIYGIELSLNTEIPYENQWRTPLYFSYTYTQSEFKSDFISNNSQWGTVKKGYELPYIPEHQTNLTTGLFSDKWNWNINLKYLGSMLESAGERNNTTILKTDTQFVIDTSFKYFYTDTQTVYLKLDNLLNRDYIVSRRPYGARPGKPFQAQIGYQYTF